MRVTLSAVIGAFLSGYSPARASMEHASKFMAAMFLHSAVDK
jgi:hypothetical protein